MQRIRVRTANLFALLILTQAAHSVEEYVFRLYDVFAPARFVAGLVSSDLGRGFALANVAVVGFGVWCYLARVRARDASSPGWAWLWVGIESVNGAQHLVSATIRGAYFPGAWTAPLLLGLALALAVALSRDAAPRPPE